MGDGTDSISPHTDKTIDIKHGRSIVNVSLGCTRRLILSSKDGTRRQEIQLPSGSLYALGWHTNIEWMHSVPQEPQTWSSSIPARVSQTLRNIATFYVAASPTHPSYLFG